MLSNKIVTSEMNSDSEWNALSKHSKTIIHIDIDCFYAQVEILKQPHLLNEPIGIKQKNLLVTCNYIARSYGIKKCMLVTEALKVCPNLLIFNGENLYKYRQASNQIHLFLLTFTDKVEKCGFDENYLDVSDLVVQRGEKNEHLKGLIGHCLGDTSNNCLCGCHMRLCIGSQIAHEIRTKLKNELGFTSCCGISYNKLLAKICCSAHKPDQQTTLLPNGVLTFFLSLKELEKIPGIGGKTKQLLESLNIRTVEDLQRADLKTLKTAFKNDKTASNLKSLSFGVCNSEVKPTEKPISIGLEDGSQKISVESDVKERFRVLLKRLMILVEEDGRVPMTVKVTVRKHCRDMKIGNKESKQSLVPASLFSHPVGKLSENSASKLLDIIMSLFCKIVDISKPFHVTLLGLAFSKFHEKFCNRSIASFLLKKRDLSVQSFASFVSTVTKSPFAASKPAAPSCSKPDSDSETEPSPKKKKLDSFVGKKKLCDGDTGTCSPSKLDVGNLSLNGGVPAEVDPAVFRELPPDVQNEIIRDWKMTARKDRPNRIKQSLIRNYCVHSNTI